VQAGLANGRQAADASAPLPVAAVLAGGAEWPRRRSDPGPDAGSKIACL